MKKLIQIVLIMWHIGLIAQNGTQLDSSRVIVGSMVVRTIDVLSNDTLNPAKNYKLKAVYKSSASSFVISVVSNQVSYQDNQGTVANDTIYYVVEDTLTLTLDTNLVVVRKSDLLLDQYPGDANKDNICNNLDILNIGASFSKSGEIREGLFFTNSWNAVKAYDWNTSNHSSNSRYSDANGDGIVDSTGDVGTIYQNYNQTASIPSPIYSPLGGPTFSIITSDTFKISGTSTTFHIGINLGINSIPTKAYGIAFTIKYDTAIFKSNALKFNPSPWFMDQYSTLNFSKINATKGEIDIAIVRKDGKNQNGGGEMGVVDILVDDILGGYTSGVLTNFEIYKALLIDSSMAILPVTLPSVPKSVILIKRENVAIATITKKEVAIYQANNNLIIEPNKNKLDFIKIYNILGSEIYTTSSNISNPKVEINIESWPSGIYLLKLDNQIYKFNIK